MFMDHLISRFERTTLRLIRWAPQLLVALVTRMLAKRLKKDAFIFVLN